MKKMYKAFVYLNDRNPIHMIVSGSSRRLIIETLTDFYQKISRCMEVKVKLKEVEYIDGDYIYK